MVADSKESLCHAYINDNSRIMNPERDTRVLIFILDALCKEVVFRARTILSVLSLSTASAIERKRYVQEHDIHVLFVYMYHDDVIKWKPFSRYWPFVRGIHRSPVNSPHKGQWRGALMFSLICVWINGWVNNREVGDLGRYRAHYDVIIMCAHCTLLCFVLVRYRPISAISFTVTLNKIVWLIQCQRNSWGIWVNKWHKPTRKYW